VRRLWVMGAALATGVAILTGAPGAAGAPVSVSSWSPEDGDEAFTLGDGWPERTPGWQGVTFESNGIAYLAPSRLAGSNSSGFAGPCKSLIADGCEQATRVNFYAILPHCTAAAAVWCVEGVRAAPNSGSPIQGSSLQSYPVSGPGVFAGDPSVNLPRGATPTLWDLPGASHSGGASTYLSVVAVEGTFDRARPGERWEGPNIGRFTSLLYPVKIQQGDYKAPSLDRGGYGLEGWNFGPECAAATDGSCARRYAFPPDTRFGMTLRLGAAPGSFFHGRLIEPTISISESGRGITIDVDASPAKVPVVATWQRWADLPDYIRAMYPLNYQGPSIDYGEREWLKDVTKRVMMSVPTAGGTSSMNELTTWLRFLGDTATAVPGMWGLSTVPGEELQGVNQCFTKGNRVNGLVTANATSYSAGPPVLDKKTQSLNYQLAAPHFTRTGEVFSGAYTLALRSDVARCIYGFTNAPIKATVQVYGADGESRVATTSVAEKNGWLTLTALNFEYSKPIISVKLTGKKKKR
jgi:hypothetical protein